MNVLRGLKYSLATILALTSLGVALNTGSTTVYAMGNIYTGKNDVTWAPKWQGDDSKEGFSRYGQSGVGQYIGGASWGKDGMQSWKPKNGTTFKFYNMGKDPNSGKQVDVWATLSDFKGVGGVGYKTKNEMSINMFSSGSESMKVKFTFRYHKTSTQVKWNDDIIGLAYTDLEPAKLGVNGRFGSSFNQSVTSITDTLHWNPWSTSTGGNTWLDTNQANKGIFQVQNKLNLPSNSQIQNKNGKAFDPRRKKIVNEKIGSPNKLNLHYIWNNEGSRDLNPAIHYAGGIGEYAANGTKSITVLLKGHSSGNNEFVFTGAPVAKKATKTTIAKSITYKGKTTTKNTLKDKHDSMVYNLNATVSAKKGATLSDSLPKRFTVTKISSVANFSHNSVAEVNSTHKFSAKLLNDKLAGKNKKITFHITGNMGDYMDDHPNVDLKWPVANQSTWYQKTTRTLKSNKVTTMYNENPNEGKGKVIFKFIDFDHHTHSLKANKVITKLAKGKTYKPAASIKWKTNGKTYKYVMGKTDGRSGGTPKAYMHTNFQDI
ncbi:hypothetical protein FC99_GL001031 [Levilactobacillus koreensis JCM 16448]|uniref:Uncharacterized protein n=1 Tax=Levilactobacillus koreensis TaxID=637971 RepID=A0AAC8ZH67_9LACO|nr:hypothetical protein [Levilactobacillus koreensis]AKP65820.1 hypothetical protein ABN16_12910 [Levilactobacillus koreensis]KRK87207.1 hypothetical protein FC99_GL001031 [Levilactobacillus koreensis JCM 16448]